MSFKQLVVVVVVVAGADSVSAFQAEIINLLLTFATINNMEDEESSYLDYETFLDPSFSPEAFANTLILATNNASDSPLDLATPLKRVLYDVQEVDTHIDRLTTASASPLVNYTKNHVQASDRILQELETQVATLTESYARLQREVIAKHEAADQARIASERLLQTVRLGRTVGRCLTLARSLEAQMVEFRAQKAGAEKRDDYRVLVRGANTVLSLRQIFAASGGESDGLDRVQVIRALRAELVDPAEKAVLGRAEQIVSQFSMSTLTAPGQDGASATRPATTFTQVEDARARATAALTTLYLLSPIPKSTSSPLDAAHLISAVQEYLRRAITSSLAGMASGLAELPRLNRALLEVSARCQNIVALEMLLESTNPPAHPMLTEDEASISAEQAQIVASREPKDLLQPVLHSLDTPSLPSYFWRSMAGQLSSRVQKIMRDGGVSSRTLRTNKDRVRDAIRECVDRGSQLPSSSLGQGRTRTTGNWEREAAVMAGSVVNAIGR